MASYKCAECERWSKEYGCSLEKESYWKFRDCMLDIMNFMVQKVDRSGGTEDDKELHDVRSDF